MDRDQYASVVRWSDRCRILQPLMLSKPKGLKITVLVYFGTNGIIVDRCPQGFMSKNHGWCVGSSYSAYRHSLAAGSRLIEADLANMRVLAPHHYSLSGGRHQSHQLIHED